MGGGDGDFVLVMLIVDTLPGSKSIVISNFDNIILLDLSASLTLLRPVRTGETHIGDCGGGMAPTLLPEAEYIVSSGVVLESLRKALARTAKLQTMRETQLCIG